MSHRVPEEKYGNLPIFGLFLQRSLTVDVAPCIGDSSFSGSCASVSWNTLHLKGLTAASEATPLAQLYASLNDGILRLLAPFPVLKPEGNLLSSEVGLNRAVTRTMFKLARFPPGYIICVGGYN